MDRYTYDLTHLGIIAGEVGRLNTVSCIPVCAGDSMEINMPMVIRMSPLRQPLTIDAKFEVFGFYIPYRHIYGDDWISFIEAGVDETTTFTGVNMGTDEYHYHGCGSKLTGNVPAWIVKGYNRIWNRWFRIPGSDYAELSETYLPTTVNTRERFYGLSVANLPSYLTALYNNEITTADYQITLSGSTLDLLDIDRLKARYKTEIDREYFARRYDEIVRKAFGTKMPPVDADERPELLFKQGKWMAGKNVDGSADGNLGQVVGKSEQMINVRMPRKHFAEHGTLWIMATVRYPVIVSDHSHRLVNTVDPSYKEISGDPEVVSREAPEELDNSYFNNSITVGTNNWGQFPYGQHYRTHPNHVHRKMENLEGYPFLLNDDVDTGTHADKAYVRSQNYDKVFATRAMAHWQVFSKINLQAHRIVPGPLQSIYAGV